jgi:hypothetical protein
MEAEEQNAREAAASANPLTTPHLISSPSLPMQSIYDSDASPQEGASERMNELRGKHMSARAVMPNEYEEEGTAFLQDTATDDDLANIYDRVGSDFNMGTSGKVRSGKVTSVAPSPGDTRAALAGYSPAPPPPPPQQQQQATPYGDELSFDGTIQQSSIKFEEVSPALAAAAPQVESADTSSGDEGEGARGPASGAAEPSTK